MKYFYLIFIIFITGLFKSIGQNTVGTLRNEIGTYNAYTLFTPLNSTETYLINNCGEVINQWSSAFTPAASVYLLENGNLLRTGKITNDDIGFGGVGGQIQLLDWDSNLLWEYTYSSSTITQHHDVYPLANGNILMLAVTTISESDAIQAGRDPALIEDGKIYNEQVLELEPFGSDQANIVWEWNVKDHLIQDYDPLKDNFGVVGDNPQLLDFNYINSDKGVANWLHVNSLQYNETLQQIIISSRILSEIYIIDHSTTTTEAAFHSGGNYGKGGDFLYRWGNPEAYDMGDSDDRTLFRQHYPHWIPDGLDDAGKILIFNNGNEVRFSSLDIISPPEVSPGVYSYDALDGYGPLSAEWSYTNPDDPANFFSAIMSSGQRLPNGNTLICDGDSGYFFEIDSEDTIVWEYINPDTPNGILSQGDSPSFNLVFRAKKYALDYPAFDGKDLTPGDPIELNSQLNEECSLLSVYENALANTSIYPNPVKDIINIKTNFTISSIEVYSILGERLKSHSNTNQIDIRDLASGVYLLKIESNNQSITKRIIKH